MNILVPVLDFPICANLQTSSCISSFFLYQHLYWFSVFSSAFTYPRLGHSGSSFNRESQTSLSPATPVSSDWGISRRSQARIEIAYLHLVLGLPRGLLPAGRARRTSWGRCPGGILTREPFYSSHKPPFLALVLLVMIQFSWLQVRGQTKIHLKIKSFASALFLSEQCNMAAAVPPLLLRFSKWSHFHGTLTREQDPKLLQLLHLG